MKKIIYKQIEKDELELVHYRLNGLLGGHSMRDEKILQFLQSGGNPDELFDFYIDEEGDPCSVLKGTEI